MTGVGFSAGENLALTATSRIGTAWCNDDWRSAAAPLLD